MSLIGEDKIRELSRRLRRATEDGNDNWEEVGACAYSYSTRKATITIRSVDGDHLHPFELSVVDAEGRVVEEFTAEVPGPTSPGVSRETRNELRQLYDLARRKAANVDVFLEELFEELPDDPGEPLDPDVPF